MTTNLTEEEREVWKDAYKLHEKYHDMTGTVEEWRQFASDLGPATYKHESNPKVKRLSYALMLALYSWFEEEQKIAQEEVKNEPAQVTIEDVIPWT